MSLIVVHKVLTTVEDKRLLLAHFPHFYKNVLIMKFPPQFSPRRTHLQPPTLRPATFHIPPIHFSRDLANSTDPPYNCFTSYTCVIQAIFFSKHMYPIHMMPSTQQPPSQLQPPALTDPHMKLAKLWGMKPNSRRGWRLPPRLPPRPRTEPPSITGRTAYKSYLSSYTQANTAELNGWDGLALLYNFSPQIINDFRRHGGLKLHVSALCLYRKRVAQDWVEHTDWSTSHIERLLQVDLTRDTLTAIGQHLRELITEKQLVGSGWEFVRFINLELHVARYKALKGGVRMKTPPNKHTNHHSRTCISFKRVCAAAFFIARSDRTSDFTKL